MMLSISTSKFLVVETSSGDYNFHRWTCKPTEYYFVNSKQTCKPSELHTVMIKCFGTRLTLKVRKIQYFQGLRSCKIARSQVFFLTEE